jgi:hypothetical protein
MNYTEVLQEVQDVFEDNSAEIQAAIPNCISRAEERIFKRVPNLPPFRTVGTGTMVVGTSTLTKPTGARVIRQVSYTTVGSEVFLDRRLDSFIKDYWPTAASTGTPLYYAETDEDTILVGPTPDTAHTYTVYHLRVPDGLSLTTANTELGDKYESVLLYAVFQETAMFLMDDEAKVRWKEAFDTEVAGLTQEVGRVYANEYGAGA